MSEKQFEDDCNDCGVNQYDYSKLNTRYEANIERNEIIEWNKDSDNAQYRDLERIVDLLNFKQMNLENCRKGYEELHKENVELKKELKRMYDVATLNKAIEVLENKYDKMLSDGSDEVKDAMRHTVLRCIEDLDELKDDITAR